MEEYFSHKCVTSSDKSESVEVKTAQWSSNNRCEYVVVQENAEANGISRIILTKIIQLVEKSKKTSKIIVFTFETTLLESSKNNSKLKHFDYTRDVDTWLNCLTFSSRESLLEKILQQVKETIQTILQEKDNSSNRTISSRPIVIIIDSLNALLQQNLTKDVVHFIKQLRKEPLVGSVIVRFNASLETKAISQRIAIDTTALVLVETASSLSAYPILSKERRRQIPSGMDGLLLLLRQKKNGRGSESLEYFRIETQRNDLEIIPKPQIENKNQETQAISKSISPCCGHNGKVHTSHESACQCSAKTSTNTTTTTTSTATKLPVGEDEISFNLNISEEERHAKSQVTLPYQHQGGAEHGIAPSTMNNNLFFIDEDDPDWDDDDLDDDLDI